MSADLPPAYPVHRSLRAALIGAPAAAGWLWNGGVAQLPGDAPGDAGDALLSGALVAAGATALAVAAFAFNDRADVLRGSARHHRDAHIRALSGRPERARALLAIGIAATAIGLTAWALLGPAPAVLGVLVAASGWVYSDPVWFGKGRPAAAAALHLLGGAANAAAGAAAAGGSWLGGGAALDTGAAAGAACWGVGCGALFFAAHLVHLVADRDDDARAGVHTLATAREPGRAAGLARGAVACAGALLTLLGLGLGGGRGAGLVAFGLLLVVALAALGEPAPGRAAWARFQRRLRLAVAAGAVAAVGLSMALLGTTG